MNPGRREIAGLGHAGAPRGRAERSRARPVPDATEPRVQAGDFKARCLELMDRVAEAGVEYTITKRGRPVAKLVPCDDAPEEAFGFLAGTVVGQADIVSPDPEAWEVAEASGRPTGNGELPPTSARRRPRRARREPRARG